jgi:hypothetical protein
MNLVGKIFIVLVFIMSCLFMGFAVAIYASHTNWKTVVDAPETGLEAQLVKEKSKSGQLASERDRLAEQRDAEGLAKRDVMGKMQTETQTLAEQRDEAIKQVTQLNQDLRESTAVLGENHKTLAALRAEVDKLRTEIRQEQQEKDTAVSKVVELTDNQHDLANELASLQNRQKALAEDHADALAVLRIKGLEANPAAYSGEAAKVDGLVLAVRGSTGLIEVSIGKDDGLLTGHTLEVYRVADGMAGTYLGKVEVTQLESNKAACRILPEFRKGTIQKGDRVASKLK